MTIRKRTYERYRMHWMQTHAVSFSEISDLAAEWKQDAEEDQSFEDFVEERGFGAGSLWVCYEEFLGAEYQDTEFVRMLLPEDDLYKQYLTDIGTSLQDISNLEQIPYRMLQKGDILVLPDGKTTTVTVVYDNVIPCVWDAHRGYSGKDVMACFRKIKEEK